MRITYRPDGTALPVYEPGDLVRLIRNEPGEIVTAFAGDWGEVIRNKGADGLDIRLAGFSRPRSSDLPLATGIPPGFVVPCDRRGRPLSLQRDLRQRQARG